MWTVSVHRMLIVKYISKNIPWDCIAALYSFTLISCNIDSIFISRHKVSSFIIKYSYDHYRNYSILTPLNTLFYVTTLLPLIGAHQLVTCNALMIKLLYKAPLLQTWYKKPLSIAFSQWWNAISNYEINCLGRQCRTFNHAVHYFSLLNLGCLISNCHTPFLSKISKVLYYIIFYRDVLLQANRQNFEH